MVSSTGISIRETHEIYDLGRSNGFRTMLARRGAGVVLPNGMVLIRKKRKVRNVSSNFFKG